MALKLMATAILMALATGAPAAPAKDGDPLVIGSVWRGKLVQRGNGADTFDCALKITHRDGAKFEAELHEKTDALELTYLVRGTIKPAVPGKDGAKRYTVEFASYEAKNVKNTGALVEVPYTGTLTGKKIAGTWKHDEYKAEGDFEFEIAKE